MVVFEQTSNVAEAEYECTDFAFFADHNVNDRLDCGVTVGTFFRFTRQACHLLLGVNGWVVGRLLSAAFCVSLQASIYESFDFPH